MTPIEVLDRIPMGDVQRAMVNVLAERFERWTKTDQIIAAVYGLRPDGGPDTACKCVSSSLHIVKRKIAPFGLRIEWHPKGGRRMVRA